MLLILFSSVPTSCRPGAGTTACIEGGRCVRRAPARVVGYAQRSVPRFVLDVVDAAGVRRPGEIRRRKAPGDQLLKESVRLPAMRDPGKGSVLPGQAHPRVLEHQETCLPLGETVTGDPPIEFHEIEDRPSYHFTFKAHKRRSETSSPSARWSGSYPRTSGKA